MAYLLFKVFSYGLIWYKIANIYNFPIYCLGVKVAIDWYGYMWFYEKFRVNL